MKKDEESVLFYEREFYVFSNFSSFNLNWKGKIWPTSEHAYQAEKFEDAGIREKIRNSGSAHEAKKLAQENKEKYIKDWEKLKVGVMKDIIRTKVAQHPYVKNKLLESGEKQIIEDSPRDDFWGWGPNKDGKNQLGKLWMEVRSEILAAESGSNIVH